MNFKAHRTAKASAISGSETLQITWFVAAKKFPLWSRITHPAPILSDSLKTAASTFALTQSSGGGTHRLVDALGSHLLENQEHHRNALPLEYMLLFFQLSEMDEQYFPHF